MKIGIITDIHENVSILEETLKKAEEYRCDAIACLGDIVGFDTRFYNSSIRRSAKTCVKLIRENCRWAVAGNHDLNAVSRLPSWSNGFEYPQNWFTKNAEEKKLLAGGRVWTYEHDSPSDLSDSEKEYLYGLPEYAIAESNEMHFLFSHYVSPDFSGSTTIYAEKNRHLKQHWDFVNSNTVNVSFIGHSHSIFAGFAYKSNWLSFKAFHSLPNRDFILGRDPVVVLLPPLSGERGKTGFTIFDTDNRKLNLVHIGISQ